ncbi:hemopexin repeat-containing protein [Paracoccus salsus]|uniref:hemopexin repeat-containing protein n=1 Tax=Paracoccus salsus TaxID=2911061 RepID=UPI001F388529|nr:hemopexin repeat-containing protein [Paracoccus salsus]MCF3975074.1 hemopexin repeat-containing protein [Paracoccus salsus]
MANERMINTVSVGVVYVSGPDHFATSEAEKAHILAEVQHGLDTLATNEPESNLTWIYQPLSVNLSSFQPWEGSNWPGLTYEYYNYSIDAAVYALANDKIYFFKGDEYIRVDPNNGWKADAGYPKPIAGNWPGFPTSFQSGLSAALWSGPNNKIYFFKGSEYIRVDPGNGWQVDSGYPKPIAGNWSGFPANFQSGVDAALWSAPNNKIYFFKGSEYIRVDPSAGWAVEAGYPKPIEGNWPGMPTWGVWTPDFTKGIQAAIWSEKNQRIYMFRAGQFNQYVRINPNDGWKVEDGYPKPVGLGHDAEAKWRDAALSQLGFSSGTDGMIQLTEWFQNAASAQFGYIIFFTKLPTAWIGYASSGSRRVTIYKRDEGDWTTWTSIDSVVAHETGHIFHAPDEYYAECDCESLHGKFIRDVNGNCNTCTTSQLTCLMDGNSLTNVCDWTRAHIGWKAFLSGIDGAVFSDANDKFYLFSKGYYARYTKDFKFEEDYPKPIAGNWPGFNANFSSGIDAALWSAPNNKIYFFKGSEYIRVDPGNGWQVDSGYPKPIAGNWSGFPTNFQSGVDAALWSEPNNKIYFFKGSEYIRVDPGSGWAVEAGYPKPIAGNWSGFPADFANGVDSATWSPGNSRIYFFKGGKYVRVNPASGWAVEGGYPRDINVNWRMAFPTD